MSPLGSHLGTDAYLAGRRGRIYEAIREDPGISRRALVEDSGVSKSALRYHLRVLERFELVRGVKADRHCRYFLRDGLRSNYEARAYARNPAPHRLLAIVKQEPGLRQHELVDRYGDGATRLALVYHLEKSLRLGLLRTEYQGVRTYWPATGGEPSGVPA